MKTKPKRQRTKIDRRLQATLNEILLRNLRRLNVTPDQRAMIASLLASGKGRKVSMTAPIRLIDVRKDDRFIPPSAKEIRKLWRGDGVLLGIGRIEFAAEILERKGPIFKGRIIESTPWLAAGTEIHFHAHNILEVFVYGSK